MAIQVGDRVSLTVTAAAYYAPPSLNGVHGTVIAMRSDDCGWQAAIRFDNGQTYWVNTVYWLEKLEAHEDTEKIRLRAVFGADQYEAQVAAEEQHN